MPDARIDPKTTQGDGIVWMTPQQYLDLTPDLKRPEVGPQAESLRQSLARGEPISEPPSLTIKDGKVTAQDGRHRAFQLQKSGFDLIPIKVDGEIPKDGKLTGMMGVHVELDPSKLQAPKPWKEVAKSPEYRRLTPEQRDAARQQYFDQVVSPRVGKSDRDLARQQFMQQTQPRVAPTQTIDPTEGMSTLDKVRAGAGKAFYDVGLGVRSMLPEAVGGTAPGEVAQRRAQDAPLMNTAAGRLGELGGSLALAAPTALIPGANTVAGAGAVGAVYGALQPAESMRERAGNAIEGGIVSGGITGAARAVPSIYRALVDPFRQVGQDKIALDTIGRFARDPNILSRPMTDLELVPGSTRSLAEVTGDPGIAQLQRAAQAASPESANVFADSLTKRLQARKDAVATIAGAPGEKEFFEAARAATAQRLYGEAFKAKVDPANVAKVAPDVKELLQRPSIQAARDDALKIAAEEGVKLTPKKLADGSIQSLHYMKKALDSQISRAKTAGDGPQAERLLETQKKLLGVMDQLSPDYKAARTVYAADSKPINRMEIGQYLKKKLFPALNEYGTERIRPADFARVIQEGDKMARDATGFPGAKLADILTTDQMKTIDALAHDVGGEAWAGDVAKVKGSPTAQYLAGQNAMRQVAGPLGMPKSFAESVVANTLANRWISLAAKPVEERIQARLAQFLTDPQTAAAAAARRAEMARRIPMSALNFAEQRALPVGAVGTSTYEVNSGNQ